MTCKTEGCEREAFAGNQFLEAAEYCTDCLVQITLQASRAMTMTEVLGQRPREQGFVLAMALMVLLLLSLLAMTFMTMGASEPRIAKNHQLQSQALYTAESGVERAIWAMNEGQPPAGLFTLPGAGEGTVVVTTIDATHVQVTSSSCVPSCGEPYPARRKVSAVLVQDATTLRWNLQLGTWRDDPS